jgi:hypothetical protein
MVHSRAETKEMRDAIDAFGVGIILSLLTVDSNDSKEDVLTLKVTYMIAVTSGKLTSTQEPPWRLPSMLEEPINMEWIFDYP